ncbi:hypothetical protein AALC17_11940 [Oscillospiraceae bacterium 38-13]
MGGTETLATFVEKQDIVKRARLSDKGELGVQKNNSMISISSYHLEGLTSRAENHYPQSLIFSLDYQGLSVRRF